MKQESLEYWEARSSSWGPAPPLSPGSDDIDWYARTAHEAAISGIPLRALQLGVTGGIATMEWPGSCALVALDWSTAMIRDVWPRDGLPPGAAVIRADWHAMPLADSSREFAAGDGCYTMLGSLEAAAALNQEVSRVLTPGGTFAIRCFARGDVPIDVDQLFDELLSGEQGNFGLFRWLLAMALQGEQRIGVRLGEVWRVWHDRIPRPEELRERFNWTAGEIDSMERWARQEIRFVFPTVDELCEIAAPYFDVVGCDAPDYPDGRHFPRLTLINKV